MVDDPLTRAFKGFDWFYTILGLVLFVVCVGIVGFVWWGLYEIFG